MPMRIAALMGCCRERGDERAMRREVTYRIGCRGVAGQSEGLAATTAKVPLTARTAAARLLHPVGPAKGLESGRARPNLGQWVLAHIPELKMRNRFSGVARQHLA